MLSAAFILAWFFPTLAFAADQRPLIRFTSGVSPTEHPTGRFQKSLYTEAFQRLGYRFELHKIPMKRATVLVGLGHFDGQAEKVAAFTTWYPDHILVKEPIDQFQFVAYTLNEGRSFASWQDLTLAGVKVSATLGAVYPYKKLVAHVPKQLLVFEKNLITAMRKLGAGRIDVMVANKASVEDMIHKHPEWKGRLREAGILDRVTAHPVLSRKHTDLVEKLSAVLRQMKQEKWGTPAFYSLQPLDNNSDK